MSQQSERWPALPLEAWQDTCTTLHMWTQIVGKIRLVQTPWVNHSWHVPLYVTSSGLTTSPIPYGARTFQIDFDFVLHRLVIQCSDGTTETLPLKPCSVAQFYAELFNRLAHLKLDVTINTKPVEVVEATPFESDHHHAAYDPEYAHRFWQILSRSTTVLQAFRARFIGKSSPVHFFWGSFDLAVTRFSGRPAPAHPGGIPNLPDWVAREAYSHEVSSCGFWTGGGPAPFPLYYAYAYPEPKGFNDSRFRPEGAAYNGDLREAVLPYETVRTAGNPENTLMEFLQSSYEAAADLAAWPRSQLERQDEAAARLAGRG